MITNFVRADGYEEKQLLDTLRDRAQEENALVASAAASVMEDVRRRGMEAVREYSLQFDGAEPREIRRDALEGAAKRIPPALRYALEQSANNSVDYHSRLLGEDRVWDSPVEGGRVGEIRRPLARVGVYVPGGTAASPAAVLMNVIPAKVAGVGEIIMVTPPTEHLNDAVLAAAWIAGVDRCIAVGGMQAIAALTFGAGFIPRVDKIVGPGNAYVAAAKRLAFGQVDIDMHAGPGEVLIIADETARARFVAADLLSMAEHDRLASAVLLTDSETLAQAVLRELETQSNAMPRRAIIRDSLKSFGAVIVMDSLDACAALANELAPEQLALYTAQPRALLPQIRAAGAVYLGENSPGPLGDYIAGPSHVLPTAGTARFSSPLTAESFVKRMSVIDFSREALAQAADSIITLAEAETLEAHANAIRVRFDGKVSGR